MLVLQWRLYRNIVDIVVIFSYRQLTKELQDVLAQDPYPKTRLPNSNLPDSILRSLNQFGLVTHGFGSPAINAAMNAFQAYLGELLKFHEGNVTPGSNTGSRNQNIVKNGDAWVQVIYVIPCIFRNKNQISTHK